MFPFIDSKPELKYFNKKSFKNLISKRGQIFSDFKNSKIFFVN